MKLRQFAILSLVLLISSATYGQQSPVRVETKSAKVEDNGAASLDATLAIHKRESEPGHLQKTV
jgi:hypothetical protein